jgi:nitrate reductase gamma subunit
MKSNWMRRSRDAVLVGLAWAVAWAPVAVLIGLVVDPDGSADEMWPAIGAYPGWAAGVVFCALVAMAEERGGWAELPLFRAGAWGAAAGLLVGVLPFTIGEATTEIPLWQLAAMVIGAITAMSAVSAVGSVLVSRYARNRLHAGSGLR